MTYTIENWQQYASQHTTQPIHELDQACWAPWLGASLPSLEGRAEVFPEGQLCAAAGETLLATLSLNRINWDGDVATLPNWDTVAGDPTDYSQTYQPDGNTLCMMSMNVGGAARGLRLPAALIGAVLETFEDVEHVIGSFRPSGYGDAVLGAAAAAHAIPSFEEYIAQTDAEGKPIDLWLRSLTKNGMSPLAVDTKAMVVQLSEAEFLELKQPYWLEVDITDDGQATTVWACPETGFFYPQPDGSYTYKESNLWGKIK